MSVEAVGAWAGKLLWAPFITYLFYKLKQEDIEKGKVKERLENTYTKQEADHMMDMKIRLIQQQLDLLPEMLSKIDKMNEKISEIHTDVEVVKSKININNQQ